MPEILKSLVPALVAAAASVVAVVITSYKNKKLTYFQTYAKEKLEAYSAFWAAEVRYEKTRSAEDEASLHAALHAVCLIAPLPIYKKAQHATGDLKDVSRLSGQEVLELVDLMRLDLDECRRLHFPKIKTADPNAKL